MLNFKTKFLSIISLLGCLIIFSACTTTVRHKANYLEDIKSSNYKVLVVPSTAEVYMLGISNKKRMYDYEYNLEDILTYETIASLKSIGFDATQIKRKELFEKSLLGEFNRLNGRFTDLKLQSLYKAVNLDEKKAFAFVASLDPEITKLANINGASFVAFINYQRSYKDNAHRTLDFVSDVVFGTNNMVSADVSTIVIALFDGKTGQLLWSNFDGDMLGPIQSGSSNMSAENEAATKRIKIILSKLFAPLAKDLKQK